MLSASLAGYLMGCLVSFPLLQLLRLAIALFTPTTTLANLISIHLRISSFTSSIMALLPAVKQTVTRKDPQIPNVLPHDHIYSIQLGGKLFRLSGASLSYDSPSYFTDFFGNPDNEGKTLSIDRSPRVFEKIAMHLRGYAIAVEDEFEFLYLFADCTYFHLERLHSRLLDEGLWVRVGCTRFHIPKALLFSPDNSPNFFTVMYNTLCSDPFLTSNAVLRPPPMAAFCVARSPFLFQELLAAFEGYMPKLDGDDVHRQALIDECTYYRFFKLQQSFVKASISTNPFDGTPQILIGYNDVKSSGLVGPPEGCEVPTLVGYSRPYLDKQPRTLVLQIDSAEVALLINIEDSFTSMSVNDATARKLYGLLSAVSDDLMYENTNNHCKLTFLLHMEECAARLNGLDLGRDWIAKLIGKTQVACNQRDDKMDDGDGAPKVIAVRLLRSQWTVSVAGRSQILLNGVQLDGVLDEMNFSKSRGWL